MTEFVASNGVKITSHIAGIRVDNYYLGGREVIAAREFFQAEHDTQLGRWRSKEHPEYVVYDHGDGRVRVMRDTGGNSYSFDRRSVHRFYLPNDAEIAFQRVAREFFAAHPEAKPWQDAKPGELWMLTVYGAEHEFFIRSDGGSKIFAHRLDTSAEYPITGDAGVITAGRRIWPEVSNA